MKSLFNRKLRERKRSTHTRCNICDRLFRAATGFHRFCKACKSDNELFKFHEWLPQG
jgi:hypothetical protein